LTPEHVLVVSADSDRSDWLETALPDSCTVGMVRETSQISQKLSTGTDVVLIDTVSNMNAVPVLTRLQENEEYEFQVGVLTATEDDEPRDVDAVLPWSLSVAAVGERVELLAARAQYRQTLSDYYEVTVALVDQQTADRTTEDQTELRARHERLETRLDEIAEALDTQALYDAGLE